jgi:hypothetical protein
MPGSPTRYAKRILQVQGDTCPWCLDSLEEPTHAALLGSRSVVDHDHTVCAHPVAPSRAESSQGSNVCCENCIRGVVHYLCNQTIGFLERSINPRQIKPAGKAGPRRCLTAEDAQALLTLRLRKYLTTYPLRDAHLAHRSATPMIRTLADLGGSPATPCTR